jgi:hypothetical protein
LFALTRRKADAGGAAETFEQRLLPRELGVHRRGMDGMDACARFVGARADGWCVRLECGKIFWSEIGWLVGR